MNLNYKNLGSQIRTSIVLVLLIFPLINFGQQETKRHYVKLNKMMAANSSISQNTPQKITETIGEKDATWLRLFFEDVKLGKNTTVTITSKLDGESQTLDSETIKEWNNSSAYFNGDEIVVTLNVAPSEYQSRLKIKAFSAGEIDLQSNRAICGPTDNRVRSNDKAIGRILPNGCSGFIIRNGRLVTAGHCVTNSSQIIEFNVPLSNQNGSINHPPVRDQYPITSKVTNYNSQNPGIGTTDWAVMRAGINSQTRLTPIQAQGKSFNPTRNNPGNILRVTGYGIDSGRDNQIQQTHAGPKVNISFAQITYKVDMDKGASGSPIIDTSTGLVVGVNTHGRCNMPQKSNSGQRVVIPAFWNAMGLDDDNPSGKIVRFVKRNASNFALDGNNGGGNGQNVYLWGNNDGNVNQQWEEINVGNGFVAYVKRGTPFALDGGNGGANGQNVYLWLFNRNNQNQHFRKVDVGGGHFRLEKRNAPAFSLDGGNGGRNGQNVYLWKSSNTNWNQHFRIETVRATTETKEIGNSPVNTLDISLYPNPVKEAFSIKIGETVNSATATIFNILGQKQSTFLLKKGVNIHYKNELGLKSGMYIIKIQTNEETITKKIVVE